MPVKVVRKSMGRNFMQGELELFPIIEGPGNDGVSSKEIGYKPQVALVVSGVQ